MIRALSQKVLAQIDDSVKAAADAGTLVRVYFEAERIRQANLHENLALEDIVEEIIRRCAGSHGYEADPQEAGSAWTHQQIH